MNKQEFSILHTQMTWWSDQVGEFYSRAEPGQYIVPWWVPDWKDKRSASDWLRERFDLDFTTVQDSIVEIICNKKYDLLYDYLKSHVSQLAFSLRRPNIPYKQDKSDLVDELFNDMVVHGRVEAVVRGFKPEPQGGATKFNSYLTTTLKRVRHSKDSGLRLLVPLPMKTMGDFDGTHNDGDLSVAWQIIEQALSSEIAKGRPDNIEEAIHCWSLYHLFKEDKVLQRLERLRLHSPQNLINYLKNTPFATSEDFRLWLNREYGCDYSQEQINSRKREFYQQLQNKSERLRQILTGLNEVEVSWPGSRSPGRSEEELEDWLDRAMLANSPNLANPFERTNQIGEGWQLEAGAIFGRLLLAAFVLNQPPPTQIRRPKAKDYRLLNNYLYLLGLWLALGDELPAATKQGKEQITPAQKTTKPEVMVQEIWESLVKAEPEQSKTERLRGFRQAKLAAFDAIFQEDLTKLNERLQATWAAILDDSDWREAALQLQAALAQDGPTQAKNLETLLIESGDSVPPLLRHYLSLSIEVDQERSFAKILGINESSIPVYKAGLNRDKFATIPLVQLAQLIFSFELVRGNKRTTTPLAPAIATPSPVFVYSPANSKAINPELLESIIWDLALVLCWYVPLVLH